MDKFDTITAPNGHSGSFGLFSEIDLQFARFITRISSRSGTGLFLAAALVSRATGNGHVCLDLQSAAGNTVNPEDDSVGVACPGLFLWRSELERADVVGRPGDERPLILDAKDRLYLFRYWEYEDLLIRSLEERVASGFEITDEAALKKGLTAFSKTEAGLVPDVPDWQEAACFMAATRRFTVISGGPGTGKSTIVGRILGLLLLQGGERPVKIALAAPTGKAAQRLQEAVRSAAKEARFPESIAKRLPLEASTIHRILGPIAGSPFFRHHAENPLAVDGVIVDEASMVDLPLMSKLVQALPSRTRLILLGDQDQLASVEAGAVLGDICDRGIPHHHSEPFCRDYARLAGRTLPTRPGPPVQDSLIRLEKNYRFGETSGIGNVSRAVNSGDGEKALAILKDSPQHDTAWIRLPDFPALPGVLRDTVRSGYTACLKSRDPQEAFRAFDRFRILCALRKGPYGVASLNRIVERILRAENLIRQESHWYRGRPILILRNDYRLGLFNGDVGLLLPDGATDGELRAFFRTEAGSLRKMHPARLPEHETVFAMTVHKSQGSEFDEVALILPDQPSPVLTRELIYTGVTRARKKVAVWAREAVFVEGIGRCIERSSGLREALWKK